ncbi:noggin-like [Phalacrocorax carbo]|uniref:noggin-like n=1 Tax=Phalacrocorax carbo TaxID=9209 RepID=UPI003119E020
MCPALPACPSGGRERGVPAGWLTISCCNQGKGEGRALGRDDNQGDAAEQEPTTWHSLLQCCFAMEGPRQGCCLLLLLLLCLILPPGMLGPPPAEPRDPLPPPPVTADPAAHLLRGHPSAPVRPYSLSLSPEDYRYSPKPRHLRPGRLRRLLGSAFDPFWMSAEEPRSRNGSIHKENLESLSRDLAEGAGRYRRKLWRETEGLELPTLLPPGLGLPPELPEALARRLRQWLVERAACRLTSAWVDLGPIFWPRWVRHTACETGTPGCSWPPGMTCRPAQLTHIKLLAWHCWVPRSPVSPHCAWRQIPYPVVAACKCSCR